MSKTGRLHSPEFKEEAIRLVHSSEDPHFSIGSHLRKGVSNLAVRKVLQMQVFYGRSRFVGLPSPVGYRLGWYQVGVNVVLLGYI
jgi:hypothetical protein